MRHLPKGVHKRGDRYVADANYRGVRKTATASTPEEAAVLRAHMMEELRGNAVQPLPQAPPSRPWTLQRVRDVAVQTEWKGTANEKNATRAATAFVRFFGHQRTIESIGKGDLDTWVAHLEAEGKSNATINRHLAAVSKMMSVAMDHNALRSKPRIPRKKESQGRIRYLSEEEERAVLETLRLWGRDESAAIVATLIDTGLRVGELYRLNQRDYCLGVLSVWETKSGLARSVPVTTRVKGLLEHRISAQMPSLLFPGNRWALIHDWNRVRSHLGHADDPQFVLHMLRHTCASRLVQRGVPLAVVQQWLGHKTIQVTLRYAHLSPKQLMDAVKVLEQ